MTRTNANARSSSSTRAASVAQSAHTTLEVSTMSCTAAALRVAAVPAPSRGGRSSCRKGVTFAMGLVVLLVAVVGCGGGGSSSDPASLADVKAAVVKYGMADKADCIAPKMVADGITNGQLDDLKKWDGSGSVPEGASIYRSARDRCVPGPSVP